MHCMEKFYANPTERIQNNKSWEFVLNWINPSQDIFLEGENNSFLLNQL